MNDATPAAAGMNGGFSSSRRERHCVLWLGSNNSVWIHDGVLFFDAWRITSKEHRLMRRFWPSEFPDVEEEHISKHILSLYRTLIYDLTSVWAIRELRQLNSSLGVSNAI